jgi:hypothetical protein
MSGMTALANPAGKAVQFDASDLSNFETMVNLYAGSRRGDGMPIEYFGLNTQNAPSAEGQRAGETRLIKKAERKQTAFGHAWEQMARIALRLPGQEDSLELRSDRGDLARRGHPDEGAGHRRGRRSFAAGLLDWETAQERPRPHPAADRADEGRRQAT